MSEDGLTWTFKLRDERYFPEQESRRQAMWFIPMKIFDNAYMREKVQAIDSVTTPDDSTVIHLKYQFSPLWKNRFISIISEEVGKPGCPGSSPALTPAVPDLLHGRELSLTGVTLEAYPGYWEEEPSIQTLHFEDDYGRYPTSITAFEAGERWVSWVFPSINWKKSRFQQCSNLRRPFQPCGLPWYHARKQSLLTIRSSRQAAAYAVNRQGISFVMWQPGKPTARSLQPPLPPPYMFRLYKVVAYDL